MKNHKTKNFLIIGTVFCALGTVLFASGIAAGGREYIKNTDLNTYNGSFSSEKSDSNHAILEKEKIGRAEFEKLFEEEKNAAASGGIVQNSEEKK